jgi:hypothetical protein
MEQKNNSDTQPIDAVSPHTIAKPRVRRCICPKCRKSNLTLTEVWRGHSTEFNYLNGKINNNRANEVGNPYKVMATCNECNYYWKLKGVTQVTDLGSGYIA